MTPQQRQSRALDSHILSVEEILRRTYRELELGHGLDSLVGKEAQIRWSLWKETIEEEDDPEPQHLFPSPEEPTIDIQPVMVSLNQLVSDLSNVLKLSGDTNLALDDTFVETNGRNFLDVCSALSSFFQKYPSQRFLYIGDWTLSNLLFGLASFPEERAWMKQHPHQMDSDHSWYEESIQEGVFDPEKRGSSLDMGLKNLLMSFDPRNRHQDAKRLTETLLCLALNTLTRIMITYSVSLVERSWNEDGMITEAFSIYYDMVTARNASHPQSAAQDAFLQELLYQRSPDALHPVEKEISRLLTQRLFEPATIMASSSKVARQCWTPLAKECPAGASVRPRSGMEEEEDEGVDTRRRRLLH